MTDVVERVYGLLKQRQTATTEDLVECIMGRTCGNRQLASIILTRCLEGDPRLFRHMDGRWQAAEEKPHESGIPEQQQAGVLCLLLIDRTLHSGSLPLGIARQNSDGIIGWMALKAAQSAGGAAYAVMTDEESAGDRLETAHSAGRLVELFVQQASLWYLGRAADMQRIRKVLGIGAIPNPIPFWQAARRLMALPASINPEALGRALGMPVYDDHPGSPEVPLRWWMEALGRVNEQLARQGVRGHETVRGWLAERSAPGEDFSRFGFSLADLESIPEQPGVYCFRDRAGSLLYVGKAKNLRRRIRSYFQPGSASRTRKRFLLTKIHAFEYHSLGSDLEALVQENRLIRDLAPVFNVQQSVRSPQAAYFEQRPAIAVFPGPDQDNALDLWCLCPGRRARHLVFKGDRAGVKRVRNVLTRLYGKAPSRRRIPWDDETLLMAAWLHRNRDAANWIDVRQAGDVEEILRQIRMYASTGRDLSNQRIIFR